MGVKRASLASSIDDLVASAEAKTILARCQDNAALAMKVLKYLEQGIFDGPTEATWPDFTRCVSLPACSASLPNQDCLAAYNDKLVTTARVDRAPDQFIKYCLCKLRPDFSLTDSTTFPRSPSDRRFVWMFALDLSASSILPAAEQPGPNAGPKKRARTDRKGGKPVRQYSALAAWAEERYTSLGSVLQHIESKNWSEY
ncbi:unnamed protein product, partial [Symbiodinium sp. CCMP2592]